MMFSISNMYSYFLENGATPAPEQQQAASSSASSPHQEEKAIETLISEALKHDGAQPIVDDILVRMSAMKSLKEELHLFRDPSTFGNAFERLQKEAVKFIAMVELGWLARGLIAPECQEQAAIVKHITIMEMAQEDETALQNALLFSKWKLHPPAVKSVIITAMKELLELYESAILTVKESNSFSSDSEKTMVFKGILRLYLELLYRWLAHPFDRSKEGRLIDYLSQVFIKYGNMDENNPENLQLGVAIGTDVIFEKPFPKTLEDVFRIAQNILHHTIEKEMEGLC